MKSRRQDKVIIFIPFSHKENNSDLVKLALKWQHNVSMGGKKVPEIVIYDDKKKSDFKYDFPVNKQFSDENVPFNTTIYMLAHGTNDTRWIANNDVINDELYQMPVELAAKRAKEMGLLSIINNIKAFKLYSCEESTNPNKPTTKFLATHFAFELGEEYDNLLLIYYVAKVCIPSELYQNKTIKKRAIAAFTYNGLEFVMQQLKFDVLNKKDEKALNTILQESFVSARKYQNVLSVKDARNVSTVPQDKDAKRCIMANQAMSIQYQIFNPMFKSFFINHVNKNSKKNPQLNDAQYANTGNYKSTSK